LDKSGLELYLVPFENSVWLLILASIMVTLIFMSVASLVSIFGGISRENVKGSWDLFWDHLFVVPLAIFWWIFGILLEQPDGPNPNLNQTSFQISNTNWKRKIRNVFVWIFCTWLIGGLMLSNEYKTFMISEYSVPFPYKTNWTQASILV